MLSEVCRVRTKCPQTQTEGPGPECLAPVPYPNLLPMPGTHPSGPGSAPGLGSGGEEGPWAGGRFPHVSSMDAQPPIALLPQV